MKKLNSNRVKYIAVFNYVSVKEVKSLQDDYYDCSKDYILISQDVDYEFASNSIELQVLLKKYKRIDYQDSYFNFDYGAIMINNECSTIPSGWILTKVIDTHNKRKTLVDTTRCYTSRNCYGYKHNFTRYYRRLSYKHCLLDIIIGQYENKLVHDEYGKSIQVRKRANAIDAWDDYPRGDIRDRCWKRQRIKRQFLKHKKG